MLSPLELPKRLQGPWQHALFMTYGADILFFENALWRELGPRCRYKVILADGKRHQTASAGRDLRESARFLNQRYVFGGVYRQHAAHAKLMLLTNEERGRLLVGSGNLSHQGYASGGELFTEYSYSKEGTDSVAAFIAVRELLEGLIQQRSIDPAAAWYVQQIFANTPWLYQGGAAEWSPVRHNLHQSFLQQLLQLVAGADVEELWLLMPFYDRDAAALQQLLQSLRPRATRLLLQPGQTSVDPIALSRVLAGAPGSVHVHAVEREGRPYIHAKLCLLKLAGRAICLQGSANMSRVAMLSSATNGNVELCNLLQGPRDGFDHLLADLTIQPESLELTSLNLSIEESTDSEEEEELPVLHLTAGEWQEKRLTIYFRGTLPALAAGRLLIAGEPFPLRVIRALDDRLILEISPEQQSLLHRPVPVSIEWTEAGRTGVANAIYPYNHAALAAEMQTGVADEALTTIGDLDIDSDLEQLVAELENALVIDRPSVWHIAAKQLGDRERYRGDEDAPPLSYGDIDYDLLRRHPRMQQYLARSIGGASAQRTRLQIILAAINAHFDEFVEQATAVVDQLRHVPQSPAEQAESEEESEADEAERQQQQLGREQRLRRIFKNFIRRYLRGINSQDFQEFAGFEVITNNTIIFSHLLWQLSLKEWFRPELPFLLESSLAIWTFFWGSKGTLGYYPQLPAEDQEVASTWLREHHADARLLAAVWYAGREARQEGWLELRKSLRHFWREYLSNSLGAVTEEQVLYLWRFANEAERLQPPRPSVITDELAGLAAFETEDEFLRALEPDFGFPAGSCRFERRGTPGSREFARDLYIHTDLASIDPEIAGKVLARWMRHEKRDHYRISFVGHVDGRARKKVVLYNQVEQIFWEEASGNDVPLQGIEQIAEKWDRRLQQLRYVAQMVDETAILPKPILWDQMARP